MKKLLVIVLVLLIGTTAIVCASTNTSETKIEETKIMNQKILVAYFSATGTTKKVAENLAKASNADIYEIKPLEPYTNADLDWTNKNSRSSIEMKEHGSRPKMVEDNFSVKEYDTIFLGFPIWWYIAPTIINTFLEKHDFSNKKIILFATSGGSRFGKTIDNLIPSVDKSTKIIEGRILNSNPSVEELKKWVETIH